MNPSQNNAGQIKLLDGNLETLGLQATLKMLALGGKTGKLHVVTEQPNRQKHSGQNTTHPNTTGIAFSTETLDIFIEDGNIVGIQSHGIAAINIIELFRLLGRISRQDEMKFNQEKHNIFLALNHLTQYGYIYPQEMKHRLDYVVIQAISHALRWDHGSFEFEQTIIPDKFPPLSVDYILLEAIRNVDEWQSSSQKSVDYLTIPRWATQFSGALSTEMLSQDEMNILFLANGHHTMSAIAFSLLLPETRVAEIIERLRQMELIIFLDTSKFEQISSIVHSVKQQLRDNSPQQNVDKRLQKMIMSMSYSIERIIDQFRYFLTSKKVEQGWNIDQNQEYQIYEDLRVIFEPIFRQIEGQFPLMETVSFIDGQFDLRELQNINSVVKGVDLTSFYFQITLAFQKLFADILTSIVMQELGHTQQGIDILEHWKAISREFDEEMQRIHQHIEGD